MSPTRKPPGPSHDSEATSRTLEQAALELLARDGVLAGLNLREVADRAGVNRGLVYHYFGSRRDLLRSALRGMGRERGRHLRIKEERSGFGARAGQVLRGSVRVAAWTRLKLLLLLDGDRDTVLMEERERTQQLLRDDQEAGYLAEDADPVALHAALVAMTLGYAAGRARLATEFGIGVKELDERVAACVERAFTGVDGPAAGGR